MDDVAEEASRLEGLGKRLNKRNFESSMEECGLSVQRHPKLVQNPKLVHFMKRCLIVLQSRCSMDEDIRLWFLYKEKIYKFLGILQGRNIDTGGLQELQQKFEDCMGEENRNEDGDGGARARSGLFEGQLTRAEEADRTDGDLVRLMGSESLQDRLMAAAMIISELGLEGDDPEVEYSRGPAASKKCVDVLPRRKIESREGIEKGDQRSCPICLNEIVVGDELLKLPCNHCIHPKCIGPWLRETNSCPICRAELPTDDSVYEEMKQRKKHMENRADIVNETFQYI